MKHWLLLCAVPAALVPSLAAAQVLEQWDRDASGTLDEAEFRAGLADGGVFGRWDEDADGTLDRGEFADGLYRLWDASGEGELSTDEWDTAVDAWFGEAAVDLAVGEWDPDGDGAISRGEFAEALQTTDLFARFEAEDEDALIGENEFVGGLFETADLDGDELIGGEEDGFLMEAAELLFADGMDELPAAEADPVEVDAVEEPDGSILERGESFVQLPIPCGSDESGDAACRQTAERFCQTLGYGPPIDFLAAEGALHAIRCRDEN